MNTVYKLIGKQSFFAFLLFSAFMLTNDSKGQDWGEVTSGINNNLNSVVLINDSIAVAVGETGMIVRTTDYGQSWSVITSLTVVDINDIERLPDGTLIAAASIGTVLTSNDDGLSWSSNVISTENLWSVSFVNNDIGFISGNNGEIRTTTDGGATWSGPQTTNTNAALFGISFIDANNGFAVGNDTTILQTNDGGVNWTALTEPEVGIMYDITYINDTVWLGTGHGVTGTATPVPVIFKTTDNGATWTTVTSSTTDNYFSITFTDSIGYITGNQGQILKSEDYGDNWSGLFTGVTTNITDLDISPDQHGYAVGDGGLILKTCPDADFTSSVGAQVCNNSEVTFTNQSQGAFNYQWDINNDSATTNQNLTHTFTDTGMYEIRLIASIGSCADTATMNLEVLPVPNADFTFNPTCFGDTTFFVNTTTFDGTGITYMWNFGDGNTEIIEDKDYVYASPGSYEVMLTALATQGGCLDSVKKTVDVNESPTAAFAIDDQCYTDSVTFDNQTTGTGSFTYKWYFGDGDSSDAENPTHHYDTTGTYTVLLVASGGAECVDSVQHTFELAPHPNASFTVNDVCLGDTTHFNNTSTYAGDTINYEWDFGDGNGSLDDNPEYEYTSAGTYNVLLIATTNFGCVDSSTQTTEVGDVPNAAFFVDDQCYTDSILFDNQTTGSGNISYKWYFGDGDSSDAENPLHHYSDPGTYTVLLLATGGSDCVDSVQHTFELYPAPEVSFAFEDVCHGDTVDFINTTIFTGDTINYEWDFGDGNGSFSEDTSYQYVNPGVYNVSLIGTTNMGCIDSAENSVASNETPTAAFFVDDQCYSDSVSFDNQTTGIGRFNYKWYFGDGDSSDAESPMHHYDTAGSYTVLMIASGGSGCVDSVDHTFEIFPAPIVSFIADNVCHGDTTHFINTTTYDGDTLNYMWDFGDGNGTTSEDTSFAYTNPGAYNVVLTASNNFGCADTVSKVVGSNEVPVADFAISDQCYQDTVSFVNQSTGAGIYDYKWDFGDGQSSNVENPLHHYNTAGVYTVLLITDGGEECLDSAEHTFELFPVPEAAFTVADVCLNDTSVFNNETVYTGDTINYQWDFGDGNGSSSEDTTYVYSASGVYNVMLTATTNHGCTDVASDTTEVTDVPQAMFTVDDQCYTDSITFNNQTTGSGTINYTWDFGDGGSSNDVQPTHHYASAGTYEVLLIAEGAGGCADSFQHTLEIYPVPEAAFTANDVCLGDTTNFMNTTTFSGDTINYSWDFGDGNGSSAEDTSYVYSSPGNFNVMLFATTNQGCVDTAESVVAVNQTPVADFAISDQCYADSISFTNQTTGAGTFNYKWYFGDSDSSDAENPVHHYASEGTYTVLLVASGGVECIDSAEHTFELFPVPEAGFTTSSTICLGDTSHFTNQSTFTGDTVNYEWDFGDGNSSLDENPSYEYTTPGMYNVMLFATSNQGCIDTAQQLVSINEIPNADFAISDQCYTDTVSFVNQTTGIGSYTYKWYFGDGDSSDAGNPNHHYDDPGTYTVLMVASGGGSCIDSAEHTFELFPLPEASFTVDNVCHGDTSVFRNTSAYAGDTINYMWDFGNGTTFTGEDTSFVYGSADSFIVTLIAETNNGCNDTISDTTIVHHTPRADFSYESACLDRDVLFENSSTIGSADTLAYSWNFGDGSPASTETNPVHVYTQIDTYMVNLQVTSENGCFHDTTINVEVFNVPVADFTVDDVCENELASFTNTSTSDTTFTAFAWTFGDGDSSDVENPEHTYTASGNYDVKFKVWDAHNCMDSIVKEVEVKPAPSVSFVANDVCTGDSVEFINFTMGAGTEPNYTWSFGDGDSAHIRSPKHLYQDTGRYEAILLVESENGCIGIDTNIVEVHIPPIADFDAPELLCDEVQAEFSNTSIIHGHNFSVHWNFGDGGTSENFEPMHTYSDPGVYTVTLAVMAGCPDTSTQVVEVSQSPTPSFTASEGCEGEEINFTNTSGNTGAEPEFEWLFGDGSTSTDENPTHVYNDHGTYNVTLTVTADNGCERSFTREVTVHRVPSVNFAADPKCFGDTTVFRNFTQIPGGGYTVRWDFGDDSVITGVFNPRYRYQEPGTYDVTLSVENSCSASITRSVEVYDPPDTEFTYRRSAWQRRIVSFTPRTYTHTSYTWLFGYDSTYSNEINPQHTYPTVDVYEATLVVTDERGCTDSNTRRIDLVNVITDEEDRASLNVYPVPFDGELNLSLFVEESGKLNVSVYDLSGRKMGYLFKGHQLDAGNHNLTSPAGELIRSEGMYIMQIEFNGTTRYRKIHKE